MMTVSWPLLIAAGMVIAAGSREPVYAGGKKGGRKSSSGTQSGGSSGGDARKSNISGASLGSGRSKTDSPTPKDKGLIVYDDLSK